jgi:Sulfotransferase family
MMTDRTKMWTPPARPEWVQRINDEGTHMNIVGVVPLDAESLLVAAQKSTGLTDFGDDDWREPFEVLCSALEEESDLNLMGRIRTRSEMLMMLEGRLQIEDWYKRHPEIDDEVITEPIFIVGQGRSGTTMLINMLEKHPDNGANRHWETTFPCPPPEAASYETDPRIERGHILIDQWNRVTPEMTSMHEWAGNLPFECCQILGYAFRSSTWFDCFGQVPSYQMWLAQQDPRIALRYHKRVLKLLQWRNPRKHWILKDPMHLDRMREILDVYPDARFLWPHRDPVKALASTVNLLGTVQWGRTDRPFQFGAFEYVTDPERSASRFNAVIDQIDRGDIPSDRLHHTLYSDLVEDPLKEIAKMYDAFGFELTEEGQAAVARYVDDHPRAARPAHRFDLGDEEMNSRDRQAFKRYQDRFGVPYEM